MSQSQRTRKAFGSVNVVNTATLNNVRLTRSSVSQGTSLTSGVTINSPAGFIFTLTTGTLATGASASFTVTNSAVRADSIVLGDIIQYGGAGIPTARIDSVTQGSFAMNVRNLDLTNSVAGSIKLAYTVL